MSGTWSNVLEGAINAVEVKGKSVHGVQVALM